MLIFLVAGCALTPEEQPPSKMVKRSQLLMGTLVQVTAVGPNDRVAAHAASAGLAEIRRLELLLSTWIPTSELSQVNAGAGLNPVAVSPDTFTVVMCAFEIARLTGGAFNIAIGPAVDAWSVMHEPRIPDDAELLRLRPLLDLSRVHFDKQARTVFLSQVGMRIDVGGIAKGFTADKAVAAMQRVGATAGVVALSGDIKTFGLMPDGKPFTFGDQASP